MKKSCLTLCLLAACAGDLEAQFADPSRLTDAIRPLFERINLVIDPTLDSYTGEVGIEVTVSTATDSIRLHGEGFQVTRATIDGRSGSRPATVVFRDHGYLVVRSKSVLGPGRHTLRLQFAGKYKSGPEGISKFRRDSLEYICTQMEAIHARSAFPCFDEPHFKILYQVSLRVPEQMFAASNMPVRTESRSGGFRTVVFDTTRPTPSYLLAFVVGPYDTLAVPGTPIPVRLIGPRGFLKKPPLVAKHLPRIIRTLEEYAGIPFPFPKLDLAYVSGFGGMAMENSGLIILMDSYGDPDSPDRTVPQNRVALFVTAHEIGHMWLGDLVTLDWWDDIWLNEGLTEWMSKAVMEDLFPDLSVEEDIKSDFYWSRDVDVAGTVQAIRRSFRGDENVEASMSSQSTLSYSKPNVVLRMVEGWVGRPLLKIIVRNYLRSHEWKTVTTGDFLAVARSAGGPEVSSILQDFVLRPGIPSVEFERRGEDSLAVKQQRYRGLVVPTSDESLWHIPIRMRLERGGKEWKQQFLLAGRDTVLRLAGSGQLSRLVPNVGQAGYYISRIPRDLAEALLGAGDCSLREKEDLLADLQYLSRAGSISPVDIIKLGDRIHPSNDSSLVNSWLSLLTNMKYTYSRGTQDSVFSPFFETQALPVLERFGYAPVQGEKETIPENRWNALELLFHRKDVHKRFARVARPMLTDPNRALTVEDARYVNNLAFDEGTDSLQSAVLERLLRSGNDEERGILAGVAGYHRGESARQRNIDFIMSSGPQPVERYAILARIDRALRRSGDTLGHRRYMEWLHDHEKELKPLVPVDRIEMYLLPQLVWSLEDVPLFERLFPPDRYSRGFQDEYRANLEWIKETAMLQERYGRELREYLANWNSRRGNR